ncbi:MAG: hypothetical protein AAGF12_34130 [Myxococcota bacterium]
MSQDCTHALIIAERNANWTPWAERFRLPDVTILVQRKNEKHDGFVSRVRVKIGELEAAGEMPQQAVVVGGGRIDPKAVGSRSTLVRALTTAMSRHGGGVVELDDSGPDRYAMAAIASTVGMLARGSGVRVKHATIPPHPLAA